MLSANLTHHTSDIREPGNGCLLNSEFSIINLFSYLSALFYPLMNYISSEVLFNALPVPHLIMKADQDLTTIYANDAYLKGTESKRENLINVPLFDAFPENPNEIDGTRVNNLRASLLQVISKGLTHEVAIQKYDIPMLDIKDKAYNVGMNDYLSKPFNPKELYNKIAKYSTRIAL